MKNNETMKVKAIIVDDEELARKGLAMRLESFNDIEVVKEAKNAKEAMEAISIFEPDICFLDIQMPGFTGFDVLTRIDELPQIIFSTAYDQYALKAFEVHAVDYLLKPYTKDRFKVAVDRLFQNKETNKAGD